MKFFKTLLTLTLLFSPLDFAVAKAHNYGVSEALYSKLLDQERQLQVYLPESYGKTERKYPLLLILDGQNYFLHGLGFQKTLGFVDDMAFPGWGKQWSTMYNKHKRHEKAQAVLLKALAKFPDSSMLHGLMGDTLKMLKKTDDAAKSYQKAIDLAQKTGDRNISEYQQKLKAL